RQDLDRTVIVSANLGEGDLGTAMTRVQQAIDSMEVPVGYSVGTGGDAEMVEDVIGSAGSALLLAVVFIYLVLASQFGSFLQPIAIMMSLPLSLTGVMVGLLIGGSTLNMFSAI